MPRLKKLDEYRQILEGLKRYTYEEFISDPEHYGCAERFLQLSIEVLGDVGGHIIADADLGSVEWHCDVPRCLLDSKIIDSEQHEIWTQMIGFRNILVHDYVNINRLCMRSCKTGWTTF